MEQKLYELNEKATEIYHRELYRSYTALAYFSKRHIKLNEIELFSLGYASGRYNIYEYLKCEGFSDDVIIASGLVKRQEDGSIVERYRNRIIFPIINEENKVAAFGGRVIDDNIKPKYINSPETIIYSKGRSLYGINVAKDYAEDGIILVEGYIDVITLNQAGIKNVVASLGTAISSSQIELIKKYTNKIYIAFDSDKAGKIATLRILKYLEDVDVKIIQLKDAKDPDEYVTKYGADKFKKLLNNSIPYFEFKEKYILKKDDDKSYFQLSNENEIIEEISKYIDIKQVSDKFYRGECPFCGDLKGMVISIEKQIYHSFCCAKGGKIENLLEEIKELK